MTKQISEVLLGTFVFALVIGYLLGNFYGFSKDECMPDKATIEQAREYIESILLYDRLGQIHGHLADIDEWTIRQLANEYTTRQPVSNMMLDIELLQICRGVEVWNTQEILRQPKLKQLIGCLENCMNSTEENP